MDEVFKSALYAHNDLDGFMEADIRRSESVDDLRAARTKLQDLIELAKLRMTQIDVREIELLSAGRLVA